MGCYDSKFSVDFLGVGPQKTGTTWLHEMLKQHPKLFLPQAVKETMFFDRRYDRGSNWYVRYFEDSRDDQLCGEVAPTYFDEPNVPERVHKVAPECDIIISLRHPAERAFSLFIHHLRKGRVPKDFWKAVERKPRIISAGHYATHIPRWRSVFGDDQVHLLFLNDIKSNPRAVLLHVCDWLDVESMQRIPAHTYEKVNAASMPRFQWLARGAAFLTTALHKYGLHRVVEFGKKLGLKKLAYTGGEDDMPELSVNDRRQVIRMYEEDIAFVEDLTDRDLARWFE